MRTKILIIALLLFNITFYGQRKYTADKYFEDLAYVKAASLYKSIYKKGNESKEVLERLADSYYYNSQSEEAEKWYRLLIEKYEDSVSADYLFKYYHVLRSNGKYKESDQLFERYKSVEAFYEKSKKLKAKDGYLKEYTTSKTNQNITVNNVSVNTKYSDFGGFLRNDVFYYTSSKPVATKKVKIYKWNNQPFLNLHQAVVVLKNNRRNEVIDLSESTELSSPIKTRYHEASAILTADGKTMYFTRDNYDGNKLRKSTDRKVNLKLYKVSLKNGGWTDVVELPFNSDEYSVGHPALSKDEKTLYFVSSKPGGYGETDIYKVAILGDNKYGNPINLGSGVNTKGKELFPFMGNDGTLYFSSNGHLGLGLLDIFKSESKSGVFSKSENLGAPFNSKKDDFSFYISDDKKRGFFSSNRKGGKGDDDIYSFLQEDTVVEEVEKELVVQEPIGCVQAIEGTITDDKTNTVVGGATVILVDATGNKLSKTVTDTNGACTFTNLPCEKRYTLKATKVAYKANSKKVQTSSTRGTTKASIAITPLIVGDQIVINPIYFNLGKSTIRQDAKKELDYVVSVLKSYPSMIIKIESHTDARGSSAYNKRLSDSRAKSTRAYIVSKGIPYYQIQSAVGYGEEQLLNDCDDKNKHKCTEEEHQVNRRSYFYIVKK